MREIKFRAWDKKNKKMIYHEKLFSIDCSNEFPFLPLLKNMYSENLDVEIMQFTGVKDSNGKEVYEGDIVRIGCEGFEKIYVVVFDDSELDYKATNGKEEYGREFEYLKCCDKIEVIGNRWDNPDLLGGEHDEH